MEPKHVETMSFLVCLTDNNVQELHVSIELYHNIRVIRENFYYSETVSKLIINMLRQYVTYTNVRIKYVIKLLDWKVEQESC